ncbi:uncharacterized protein METZ01_LOCUS21841, partial [marine metagenome]
VEKRSAGGTNIVHDGYLAARRQRSLYILFGPVGLAFFAHDEGRNRPTLQVAGQGHGRHNRVCPQGCPTYCFGPHFLQQWQQRLGDEISAFRIQAQQTSVEVIAAFLP